MRKLVYVIIFMVFLVSTYPINIFSRAMGSHNESEVSEAQSGADWWPMFRHDLPHTGYSNSTAPNTNYTAWVFTHGDGGSVFSSPAVADGKVFVGSMGGSLYALNDSTGAKVWNYSMYEVDSSPAVAEGMVFVGSYNHNVYALNASTGARIWNFTTTDDIVRSSPAVVDGTVYIGSMDNKTYALNENTGNEIWNYTTDGPVYSSPAVVEDIVYIGSVDGNIYALNASTGALIWNYKTGQGVYSSPAVVDGMVFVGSNGGKVYALNAATAALMWNSTTTGGWTSPAVAYGKVYLIRDDGYVYALNETTGDRIWFYYDGNSLHSSPCVADGKVFVNSNDFYALDASTGNVSWRYRNIQHLPYPQIISSPAVADGKVFIGSYDGEVYAFGAGGQLVVSAHSPVNILVAAPNGSRVGYDSVSQSVVNEIEGATYSGIGTEPQTITIPSPQPGNYTVDASGNAISNYQITVESTTANGALFGTLTLNGSASEGKLDIYSIKLNEDYTLVPEFPFSLILLQCMLATLLSTIVCKKRKSLKMW